MIFDARDEKIPGRIEADFCIIGAGATGITLARELALTGKRVAVLESGGEEPEIDAQDLCEMELKGLEPRTPPVASRLRFLGGTTNHWGGWNRPFSRRAVAKWPIAYEELSSRFTRVNQHLQLLNRDFDSLSSFPQFEDQFFADYGPGLVAGVRQVRDLRFWKVYGKELTAQENVTVASNANLIDFNFMDDGETIQSAIARTSTARQIVVDAKYFVLACGGLENSVVLLNIDRSNQGFLSRKSSAIGRYYSDHAELKGDQYALSCFIPALSQRFWDVEGETQYLWTRMFLALDPALFPQFADFPHAFNFYPFHSQCQYRSKWDFDNLYERISQFDANYTVPSNKPQDPAIDLEAVFMQFAATPNSESRITLSDKETTLGTKMGVLDWRILAEDVTIAEHVALAGEKLLVANGVARMRLSSIIAERGLVRDQGQVYNASHHMGGTRMGADPATSVVDADCRFHGTTNFFVAGPSVFPSFDWPGPTYTAVALAMRLSDHLAQLSAS